MVGLAGLNGVAFWRRNPNITTCTPHRSGRIIRFCDRS